MGTKPILFINAVIIFPHISGEINRVLKIVYLITWDFSERKEFSLPTCTGRKLFSFKTGSCLERAVSSRRPRENNKYFSLWKKDINKGFLIYSILNFMHGKALPAKHYLTSSSNSNIPVSQKSNVPQSKLLIAWQYPKLIKR